ncbi:cardiolipin synthase/hydrolase fusion protein [Schizosaccharomyces japonicus yFS275]|uniref:Cardiolipin synthase/hydrolase fusion protein n=1 Tax=Schizosaccharomyces japonicus (strain yFS275 / FY16936) TaxID=402676 RepID=B6K6I4_SCHJY|nr:cardiolipin synthase/hydrolase fusion protein [Schizosaccharomyces japonicus yFS275]EEB09138.1 cardiolipin synthase/hydrolase fusion protein [Schizosaccharomyces japonicus yFS275]
MNVLRTSRSLFLRSFRPSIFSIRNFSKAALPNDVAFAFDIDGVLIRGGRAIKEGTRALQFLKDNKIPFILLTNGGGVHESVRAKLLSTTMQVDLKEKQFCQSHTPFRTLTNKYKNVLVMGGFGNKVRETAEAYGFEKVITDVDVLAKRGIPFWPFTYLTEKDLVSAQDFDDTRPIDAVFTYVDPVNFGLDLQLLMELACSKNGVLGTQSPTMTEGPDIYFSNADLIWPNEYNVPRLGQGAFGICCENVYRALSGKALKCTYYGKPHSVTYKYATNVLNDFRREMNATTPLREIFMVGDNPASDIRGANSFGWTSILVRTGVFQGKENSEQYPAKHVSANVWEAVQWALTHTHKGTVNDSSANGRISGRRAFHSSSISRLQDERVENGVVLLPLAILFIGRDLALISAAFVLRLAYFPKPLTMRRFFDMGIPVTEMHPTRLSKWNTALQLLLLGLLTVEPLIDLDIDGLKVALMYITAITTASSGLSYVFSKKAVKILTKKGSKAL